jgi:WD40 repeat protein
MSIDHLAVSPDGRQLALADIDRLNAASGGRVSLWDTRTWHRAGTVASFPALEVTRLAFSADSRAIAIGAADGTAGIWQTDGRRLQLQSFLGHTAAIAGIAFRPGAGEVATTSVDGTARVWRTGGRERLDVRAGSVNDAFLGPDRLALLTDGKAQTLALPGGRQSTSFALPSVFGAWARLSGDGTIAVVGQAGRMTLRHIPDGQVVGRVRGLEQFEDGNLSPDDRHLIILRGQPRDPLGVVVDLRTGHRQPLAGLLPSAFPAWRTIAFTRDGRTVAAGSFEGGVVVWDLATGRRLGSFTNRGQVSQVAFSSDGRRLAVGSWDGTVTIWDARTRRALRVLHGPTRGVAGVAWSGQRDWLAASSLDHTVTIWDSRTWKIARVLADPAATGVVAFSPDGRSLMTSDNIDTVRLWDTCPSCRDPKALLAEARRSVTRGLTPEERKTFLSGY